MSYLTQEQVSGLVSLPIKHVEQEYPNHITHSLSSAKDVGTPKELHPVFYGCLDWHSCVHGYWLMMCAIELYPDLPEKDAIVDLCERNFQPELVVQELKYFTASPFRAAFERPYGHAWFLALTQKIAQSHLPQAKVWSQALDPLRLHIRQVYMDYVQALNYPVRIGMHINTAFSLVLAHDAAKFYQDEELSQVVKASILRFYAQDKNYPFSYEPSGADFLSNGLAQALAMSLVLSDSGQFQAWWDDFVGSYNLDASIFVPAIVGDASDPQLSHLEGLNLSRAWCLTKLALAVDNEAQKEWLHQAAQANLAASINNVIDSHYSGSHWLATYAFLALSI